MKQLSFLASDDIDQVATAVQRVLDADSERLLKRFQAERLKQNAHPQSVRREVSQLRAIAREAGMVSQPSSLRALFADLSLVARVLREPSRMIARSTGRTRLLAAQRFVQIMGRRFDRNPV